MQLPPFKIERYFAQHEFTARYLLSSSDCEAMSVGELLSYEPGAEAAFREHWLGYTESAGDPALREAIAGNYETVEANDILVHTGVEEAIFSVMNCLLGPGDHAIVHAPRYQSLAEVARGAGAEVTDWPADPGNGWALDPGRLKAEIRPNTRVLVVNCPHNPTGYLMPRERFDAVVELARRHGLWLFSDEVYRELEYDPAERLPAACELYEKAVSLGVLSKTYGLPGLRIGWIATRDRALLGKVAAFKDYLTICNSAPSEFLARIALKHRAALAERSLGTVTANLERLDRFFAAEEERFAWTRPKAGPIAFMDLRQGGAADFCRDLLERVSVLLLPAGIYDAGDRHVRIGFGRRNLPEALARLEDFLSD